MISQRGEEIIRILPIITAVAAAVLGGCGQTAVSDAAPSGSDRDDLEPTILIESAYPGGGAHAVLEDDGRTVYLYLVHDLEEDEGHSVWVANRVAAPQALDPESLLRGEPPLNPIEHCAHPEGAEPLEPDRLELVWLPEGDGVALFEKGSLLAAIPGWADGKEFFGYAREAQGQGPLAWELPKGSPLLGRFAAARRYWQSWSEEATSPWPRIQEEQLSALRGPLGEHDRYFAIDGGRWPPKAMVEIRTKDAIFLVTVGMALRPMPAVEQYVEDAAPFQRAKLGMVLPPDADKALVEALRSYVAGQANLPWEQRTWLGHGHTVPCWQLEAFGYPAAALLAAPGSNHPVELPPFDGDRVTLLWLVPITADEWARAKAEGTDSVLSGVRLPRSLGNERPPS